MVRSAHTIYPYSLCQQQEIQANRYSQANNDYLAIANRLEYLRSMRSRRSSCLRHSNGRPARMYETSTLDRSRACSSAPRRYVRSHDSGNVGVDRTVHGKIRDGQLLPGYQCLVCTLRSDMMGWSSGTHSVQARLYLTH